MIWKTLSSRKEREEFQRIVTLLAEFDERTGRFRRFPDQETHHMRKAMAAVKSDLLKIYISEDIGGHVYKVVVELQTNSGYLVTAWIHEDGIRNERDVFALDKEHPVHSIRCMTDLFDKGEVVTEFSPHVTELMAAS